MMLWFFFFLFFRLTNQLEQLEREISLVTPHEQLIAAARYEQSGRFQELLIRYEERSDVLSSPMLSLAGETLLTHLIRYPPASNTPLNWIIALVHKRINPTVPNGNMETPLFVAIDTKDTLVATFLVHYIVKHLNNTHRAAIVRHFSLPTTAGQTVLCRALETEQLGLVDLLLDAGVKSHSENVVAQFCEPLLLAVRHADAGVINRLLPEHESSSKRHVVHRALKSALELRRDDVTEALLRHLTPRPALLKRLVSFPELWQQERLVELIFDAIERNTPSPIVEAMVELQVTQHNPFLCVATNADGRSLLYHAILYGYVPVVKLLVAFYNVMVLGQHVGYSQCYADEPDKSGQCPSAAVLWSERWSNVPERDSLVRFLLSQRHPLTGENCLHRALQKKEIATTVFQYVGSRAVEEYGPEILDLAGEDTSGVDVFFRAIESEAPPGVITLLLQWLTAGSQTNLRYRRSLIRGLFVAAGGAEYLKDPFVTAKLHPDAISIAAVVCPAMLQRILLTTSVLTPSDEQAYRQILQVIPGPFLSTPHSPLSHAIKALLSPENAIDNAELVVELAGAHNWCRFTEEHFTYALDQAGRSDILVNSDVLETSAASGVHRRHSTRITFWAEWFPVAASWLRRWSGNDPLYSILGDERVIQPRDVLRIGCQNPYASSSFSLKRARVIVELLSSPLGVANGRIRGITVMLLCSSTLLMLTVCGCLLLFFRSNATLPVDLLPLALDSVPRPRSSWCSAFFEGLRRSCLVPRRIAPYILFRRTQSPFSMGNAVDRSVLHVLHIMGWAYQLSFLWYLVEAFILVRHTLEVNEHPLLGNGLTVTYTGPLRYLFPATVLLHTVLSKMTCPEHAVWIRWMLFGVYEEGNLKDQRLYSGKLSLAVSTVTRRFYWLPGSKRAALAYLRGIQRLRARAFLKRLPLRFNKTFTRFRLRACKAQRSSQLLFRCCQVRSSIRRDTLRQEHVPRLDQEMSSDKEIPETLFNPYNDNNSALDFKRASQRSGNRRLSFSATRLLSSDEMERQLLTASIAQFGLPRFTGYGYEMVMFYMTCGIVAQFPLWRCLNIRFRVLYFDVYNSRAKYLAYMEGYFWLTFLRELAMFCVVWQELIQMGLPIFLALRLSNVMRRTAVALKQTFPIQTGRWLISVFTKPTASKTELTRGSLLATECNGNSTAVLSGKEAITAVKVYVDVRQTLFNQFAYVWAPVETCLNVFLLYWGFHLVVMFPWFYRGALGKLFFISSYNQLGSQIFLALLWIQWLSVQAFRANADSDMGWVHLQCLNLQPKHMKTGQTATRVLFQAIKFFKTQEFRLTLAGVQLSSKFASAFCFFCAVIVSEFTTLIVRYV